MNRSTSAVTFAEIHALIGSGWPAMHEHMGVPPRFLRNRHGPCPCCGGTDRFRYDNKDNRGTFFCSHCKAGDGVKLLELVHGWTSSKARAELIAAMGIVGARATYTRPAISKGTPIKVALPTSRVLRVREEACALPECPDGVAYLKSRGLWLYAATTTLRAHTGLDYYDVGAKVGRYPAMLASVRDLDGELVTMHVTYLDAGRKLAAHEPRKILGGMQGRSGCAVRLYRIVGGELGVAEGIETAIAASAIHAIPTWAALNTAMLAKFTPPPTVRRLVIFADNDHAGLEAAAKLSARVRDHVQVELRTPPTGYGDWADVLVRAR